MNLSSNIWKLYVIKTSKWLMLYMPILWLFYEENGLTISDLFIIQSIYSVTIALIEIPSGYVADIFGRKNSMVVGTFFGFIGMLTYSYSFGFNGFLIAALCLGIGQSFISGSDSALLYDSLLANNREKDFVKFDGKTISIGNIAEAVAGFIGAYFLTEISYRTPFYYQSAISFVGFFVALFLIEPEINRLQDGKNKPWKNIKNIIRFVVKENLPLRRNIIYSSIIGAATLTMAWFIQPLLDKLSIPGKYNGIILGILNLAVAFTAFYAYKVEKRLRTKFILIAILILISGTYFMISYYFSYWVLGIILLFYFTRGIATPVLRNYQNQLTPPEMRATVMSIRSFIIRVVFAMFSPILGYTADVYSLQEAFLLCGLLFLSIGSISVFFVLKNTTT